MIRNFVAASLVALLFFSLPVGVLAEKLAIATAEWPPYVIVGDGGTSGLDVEIINELCNRLKLKPEFRVLPWKRAVKYAKKGKTEAIFAPRRTEERDEFLFFPSEPLNIEKTVILARKGSGVKASKIDDLKAKRIGVVRGYTYGSEFDGYQEIKRTICDDDKQLVNMFVKKRVELAAGSDEGTMRYLCKKAGIETEVVYVFSEVPSYIAFSKTLGQKGKELAEKFSEALKKLKEEGFIEKVQSKYF